MMRPLPKAISIVVINAAELVLYAVAIILIILMWPAWEISRLFSKSDESAS